MDSEIADEAPSAWLCMAVSGRRQHGGNDGYDDLPSSHYSWDSTVPNHSRIREGDVIVLWDKVALLGASVVEGIEVRSDEKDVHRCRYCGLSGIKARSSRRPRYKCYKCKEVFEEPVSRRESVETYRSRHGSAWVDLEGRLSGAELRNLCESPRSQLSLRPLRMGDFVRALGDDGFRLRVVETAQSLIRGGHRTGIVRVRLGQAAFRRKLVDSHGAVCAFTGDAPLDVLDACHLYSYAAVAEHRADGGLLLRRDVHSLFDAGAIAVDPGALTLDIIPRLRSYEVYGRLHGERLRIDVSPGVRLWLGRHWAFHRGAAG